MYRLAHGSIERNLFSVRANRESAGVHIKRSEFHRLATTDRDRIDSRRRQFVVRLVDAIRREVNLRTVFGPGYAVFGKATAGQLFWRDFLVAGFGRRHNPDVVRVLCIRIPGAVETIDSPRDHAHVTLTRLFRFFGIRRGRRRSWARGRRRGLGRRLCQVFDVSAVAECDHLAIRRPLRATGAARHRRQLKRVATSHRQHEELRHVRPAVFLSDAHKGEELAIGRPAWRRVSGAAG